VIAAEPHRVGVQKDAHVQGWLVSVLLHGTVALTAILTVKQIQLTPQDEAFKWNVAMVSSAQPTASSSNQAQAQSVQSTTSAPPPPVRRSASPQAFAPLITPSSSEQLATTGVAEPSLPQLTTPSPPTTHTIQPAEPIRHKTVAPIASAAESGVRPDEMPMAVSTSTNAETEPSSAQPAILEQTTQSDQDPAQIQVAAISSAPSNAPTKRDYGWLSEVILRRVEELKRYPASARADRAEGKVVVKAVIDENGSISEVGVFQSSGYPTLDEAAIQTMRQAAPLHLPHPLGQSRMTIKIPMNYRLDR
jgi:periplasmic protein TonB